MRHGPDEGWGGHVTFWRFPVLWLGAKTPVREYSRIGGVLGGCASNKCERPCCNSRSRSHDHPCRAHKYDSPNHISGWPQRSPSRTGKRRSTRNLAGSGHHDCWTHNLDRTGTTDRHCCCHIVPRRNYTRTPNWRDCRPAGILQIVTHNAVRWRNRRQWRRQRSGEPVHRTGAYLKPNNHYPRCTRRKPSILTRTLASRWRSVLRIAPKCSRPQCSTHRRMNWPHPTTDPYHRHVVPHRRLSSHQY
jgi:hypothetical protein